MPKVDPFIPVNRKKNTSRHFVHPRSTGPTRQPLAAPPEPHRVVPPKAQTNDRPSRFKQIGIQLLQVAVFLALFILGFLMRSIIVGQGIIVIYAVISFVFKIKSRVTFILALMALGLVLIGVIRSDTALTHAFATYALLLIIIGVIGLWREVRSEI